MNALAVRPNGVLRLPYAVVRERRSERWWASDGCVSRARSEACGRGRQRRRQANGEAADSRATLRGGSWIQRAGDRVRRRRRRPGAPAVVVSRYVVADHANQAVSGVLRSAVPPGSRR